MSLKAFPMVERSPSIPDRLLTIIGASATPKNVLMLIVPDKHIPRSSLGTTIVNKESAITIVALIDAIKISRRKVAPLTSSIVAK
jgi:hypothetical protein